MLCKTIIKLLYHAIISKTSKTDPTFKKKLNQAFTVDPCMIVKRLDQNSSRWNLKLLYSIPLFQNFKFPHPPPPPHPQKKRIKKKNCSTSNQAQAVMLEYL